MSHSMTTASGKTWNSTTIDYSNTRLATAQPNRQTLPRLSDEGVPGLGDPRQRKQSLRHVLHPEACPPHELIHRRKQHLRRAARAAPMETVRPPDDHAEPLTHLPNCQRQQGALHRI